MQYTIQLRLQLAPTKIYFALPNPNANLGNTSYFWTKINSENIEAAINAKTYAKIHNIVLTVETSNFMDTTKLPNILSSFSFDSLSAGMDTLKFAVQKPSGTISLVSQKGSKALPAIKLSYQKCSNEIVNG